MCSLQRIARLQQLSINILGDINLNYGNELKINTNNILDIKSRLSGSGTITGSTSSDVTISGNGAAFIFNSGGSGFRNFTVSRPNGVSIDSTITIYETLSLQNKAKLYLPAGKAANKNFSFSVGQTTSTGAITGDGYLAQPAADNIYQLADVTINGTAADVPLRFSQTGSENIIHNFTINKSSGNVNLVDGETLQIRNTFIITNGNLAINTGTLKLTGSIKTGTTSTLSGSANANLFIGNDAASLSATLYFNQDKPANHLLATYIQNRNGTITLGNALSVNQLVDVGSDNAANILNSASNLTLVSDEYTTARVANFYAASITDSVMVQRFIKGGDNSRRSYRLLSSPVYQVANARPGLARYYFSRLQDSILITGAGGVSKGFDASPVNGPTIWKYNETNATSAGTDFIPISSINKLHDNSSQDQLTAGNGFLLFFRGDRSHNVSQKTTPPFATPESVVLNYKGLLNQGDITVTAPFGAGNANLSYTNRAEENDGFNLMGNPYASTIDWELSGSNGAAISLTNVNPTIYILDPVTKNYGTYTRGGVNTGKATRYISSGQGFFVKANGANPALTFTEAAKVSQNTNPAVLSANKPTDFDFIRLSLSKDSVNKDDILLTFKIGQQQKFINNEDIADLQGINAAVSLSSLISANNGFLAVNGLPPVDKTIIIPLNIDAAAAGVLNLSLDTASAVFKTRHVYLRDKFLKDSVDLNLTSIYTFSISKTDSATFGSKRFEIYFHDNLPDKNSITIGNTVSTPVINPAQIRLFPNPASAEINIIPGKQSIKNIKLSIYNVLGIKKLTSVHSGLANFKQNIAALIPGIYVAELTDLSSGIVIQQLKFIKK